MNPVLTAVFLLFATTKVMAGSFIYDIQLAGYDFDQYDRKGEASYEIFLDEFRNFSWSQQLGKTKDGSAPTITVRDPDGNTYYWVSAIGEPEEFEYLVGIVRPKTIRPLLGFGAAKEVQWLTIYVAQNQQTIEQTFKLYFDRDLEGLDQEFSKLSLFAEQEAR